MNNMMYCPNCKTVKADNGLDSCDDCLEWKKRHAKKISHSL